MLSVDLFANEDADANVIISETQIWTTQGAEVCGMNEACFSNTTWGCVPLHAGGREGAVGRGR